MMDGYTLDPNMLVSALSNRNGNNVGPGGWYGGGLDCPSGGNGLLWIFLLIIFGGGGFGGNGFWGNRGGGADDVSSAVAAAHTSNALQGQLEAALQKAQNANLSDAMLLEAIKGNDKSLSLIAHTLEVNSDIARNGIETLKTGIANLSCQVERDTASIIHQVSIGQADLSRQLASCCCDTQRGLDSVKQAIADCCCTTQRSIDATRYDMATGFCAVNNNIQTSTTNLERFINAKIDAAQSENRAGFQGIRDYMVDQKIERLSDELQTANLTIQNNAQTQALKDYIDSKCVAPTI